MSGLAIGALLVTALVVLRQLLTVRENVRLLAETAARQNEARFRSLVQHSSDVILVTRADGTIRFVSPSATRVFGYDPAAMIRQTVPDLLHPEDRERAATFFRDAALAPGRHRAGRVALPPARRLLAPRRDPGDQPAARRDGQGHRAQHPRRERAEAAGGAAHPPGVPRSAHRARQPGAVPRPGEPRAGAGAAAAGTPITVLFLDLDDFKTVNDSLGHAEGDRLLIAAAERFLACARSADTVARLGGDEFAILIEGADGREGLPDRLVGRDVAPVHRSAATRCRVTASIGVASAVGDDTADDLLRNADVAMYAAKRHGKGRAATYESRMYADIRERLDLEAALRAAIERQRADAVLPADRRPPDRRDVRGRGAGPLGPPAVRPAAARSTSFRWPRRPA